MYLFFLISWRLITLQYCSGFCHTLTWISHGYTCIPHPDPPSHLPLHLIPLGLPSAPGPSTCLVHPRKPDLKETRAPQCSLQHCFLFNAWELFLKSLYIFFLLTLYLKNNCNGNRFLVEKYESIIPFCSVATIIYC